MNKLGKESVMKNNRKNAGLFFILLSVGLVLFYILFEKIGCSNNFCGESLVLDMTLVISSFVIFIVGLLFCYPDDVKENDHCLDSKIKRKEHQNE